MKRSNKQTVDVLNGLIAERQKYEQWIAALEAKKASTPAKVYERVHGDYLSRLEGVMAELSARSGELEAQRAVLKARSDELTAQETMRREERAEADLRNDVGEYAPDEWKDVVRTSDAAIAKLVAERAQIDAELEHIERILAGTAAPTGTPARSGAAISSAPAPAPAAAPAPPPPGSAAAASAAAASASPASAPPTHSSEHRKSFDELAFLQSVVPPGGAADASATKPRTTGPQPAQADLGLAHAAPPPAAAPPSPAPSTRSAEGADMKAASQVPADATPAAAAPKAHPTPARSAPVASPTPSSGKSVAPPPAAKAPEAPASSAKPESPAELTVKHDSSVQRPAAPQRSSRQLNATDIGAIGIENLTESLPGRNETPTFLKNVPSEQTKTLKCGECGAMNYATEWYCERCGAELSAL